MTPMTNSNTVAVILDLLEKIAALEAKVMTLKTDVTQLTVKNRRIIAASEVKSERIAAFQADDVAREDSND